MTPVPGLPFGVAARGSWAFVSRGSSVAVLRTGSFRPVLARSIPVPGALGGALGDALTPDGRYLLVASGDGAVVISVARAEDGRPHPVLGTLTGTGQVGAIEAAVSPDGQLAFVSMEDSAGIAVFRLARALRSGFGPADFAGTIPAGRAPVGLAISPDGRWLYATSELEAGATSLRGPGTLSVISIRRARTAPADSVLASVTAGCQPVRVILSAGGMIAWVTARGSDALLAFRAGALRTDPTRSLAADIRVGEAPVGLALAARGTRLVIADSDRFAASGATASLAVVSVPAALAHRRALLGVLPAGSFPREMAAEPGGQVLLVTNYGSGQLESVNLAALP